MADERSVVQAFSTLDATAWSQLKSIHVQIQAHDGTWGELRGGEIDADGTTQEVYWARDPLIDQLVDFLYSNDLDVTFDWMNWEEGRKWYQDDGSSKYNNLDVLTTLKLLNAVIRNDRFHEGALVAAFESGEVPRLVDTLVRL